jgi:hypothetical protein
MFNLEKKIDTEQKFANLVYKDFQTKRFGLTPCCDVEIDEIKLRKYLCDYQEQKEHDDALEPTPDLDITVVDCDAVVPVPEPTPPDDTPFPALAETCRSIDLNGIDQRIFIRGTDQPYTNFNFSTNHSHSVWFKRPGLISNPRGYTLYELFYTRYELTSVGNLENGMGFGYIFQQIGNNFTGEIFYLLNKKGGVEILRKGVSIVLNNINWINVTVTTDGTTLAGTRFYVNGAEVTTPGTIGANVETLVSTITFDPSTNYEIGAVTNTDGETAGIYSEFRIHSLRSWDVLLTPAEVLSEYNNGFLSVPPVRNANCVTNVECNTSVWNLTNTEFDIDETQLPTTWSTDNALITDLVNDCPNGI